MYEFPSSENPVKTKSQPNMDALPSGNQILDDMYIREFIDLLKEQGKENDAQFLSDIFEEMADMDEQFSDMNKKNQELQSEVEHLRGETLIKESLKAELFSRAVQLQLQIDELSQCFLDTKDYLVSIAKEGLRKFTEAGKTALHIACASMCDAGIRYFEGVMLDAHQSIENNENILKHLDELNLSTRETRKMRSNLIRAIFHRPDAVHTGEHENVFLHSIRTFAEHGVRFHGTNLKLSAEMIDAIESFRDKQLAAAKNKQSLDSLLQSAKSKVNQIQNNINDKLKSHDNSDLSR